MRVGGRGGIEIGVERAFLWGGGLMWVYFVWPRGEEGKGLGGGGEKGEKAPPYDPSPTQKIILTLVEDFFFLG